VARIAKFYQPQDAQTFMEDERPMLEYIFESNAGDTPTFDLSETPAQIPHPPLATPFVREEFIGAAEIYDRGLTFMDEFNGHAHACHRKNNTFYPFASQQDWKLALFLLSSGMSMAQIDQSLGLELVCIVFGCDTLSLYELPADKAAPTLIPDYKRLARTPRIIT
jgi:hypothetical protein